MRKVPILHPIKIRKLKKMKPVVHRAKPQVTTRAFVLSVRKLLKETPHLSDKLSTITLILQQPDLPRDVISELILEKSRIENEIDASHMGLRGKYERRF